MDRYIQFAQSAYPTKAAKLQQLARLRKMTDKSGHHGLDREVSQSPVANDLSSMSEEQLLSFNIHLVWWCDGEVTLNTEVIGNHLGIYDEAKIHDYYSATVNFHEEYGIKEDDWILWWKATNDRMPWKNSGLYWTQAHAVLPNGVIAEDEHDIHTKLVAEIANYGPVQVPFELTSDIQSLIKEKLREEKYTRLRNPHDEPFTRQETLKQAHQFLLETSSALSD